MACATLWCGFLCNMIITSAEFITSAVKPTQYPEAALSEIAFAGRSNVGKSSLINTLVNRKRLVKTSSTPGRTRLINFFEINKTFCFVDLPGYGYAKVHASVRNTWGPMVETYIESRKTLKGVVLIMDVRRSPDIREINFINWVNDVNIPFIPVLTKADKLSKTNQKKQLQTIADTLLVDKGNLILFSSKSRTGKEMVWAKIGKLLA